MKRNLLSILFLVGIAPAMLGQQLKIDRIELMPNKPEPYIMRDWKQVAIGYDSLVYDVTKKGEYLPLTRITSDVTNFPGRKAICNTLLSDLPIP